MGVQDLSILTDRAIKAELAQATREYSRPAWVDQIAHVIEDKAGSVRVPWVGGAMGMERRYGADKTRPMQAKYIDLDTVEYVHGAEIPYKDMRHDRTATLNRGIHMQELATNSEEHWEELVAGLLEAIESTVCYDGQYMVDTDHVDTGAAYTTAQDNDINVDLSSYPSVKTGSTTKPSPEDIVWAAAECIRTLVTFKDDHGRYVNRNAKKFLCFLPLTFWAAAIGARSGGMHGYGASSILKDFMADGAMSLDIIPLPWLTWTTKVLVVRSDAIRKPIVGLEEPLEGSIALKIYTAEGGSDWAKENERTKIVRRANRTLKFGDWRNVIMGTLT